MFLIQQNTHCFESAVENFDSSWNDKSMIYFDLNSDFFFLIDNVKIRIYIEKDFLCSRSYSLLFLNIVIYRYYSRKRK